MKLTRLWAALAALLLLAAPALAQVGGGTATYSSWYPTGVTPSTSVSNVSANHLYPSVGPTFRVCNVGTVDAYINPFGTDNTVTATTNSFWLQAGTCQTFNLKPFNTQYLYFASITAASTTTLYVETGLGQPVSAPNAAAPPLPAGAATAANQVTGNASLATIATNSGTQATAANQTTGNSSLATIATNTGAATPAGTNIIGKVGIDQTTPGTTNGVQVNAALPAGSNLLGKTGIDQTTPGTTNGVVLNAGTNIAGKVGIDQTTPGTTNGVSLAQIGATTVSTGTGAQGAGSQRVAVATDTATIAGSAPGTAGSASANVVTTQGIAGGTPTTIGGTEVHLTNSPTVTAGAYTTGQVVGGLQSITGAVRTNGNSAFVQTIIVTVKTALTAPYDVLVFDTNPVNSTFTDNSALAVNVADLPFLIGIAHCTDLVSLGTPQALQATNLAFPVKNGSSNTTLYFVIVIRGGQTFASTSAVQMTVGVSQD